MFMTMLNPFAAGAAGIDPVAAVSLVKKKKAVLVDVREPSEFHHGHAAEALNIPMGEISTKADPNRPECPPELKEGKPVILYCASGARSGMAGKVFRHLGHTEVFNLGSLSAWQGAGGRVSL